MSQQLSPKIIFAAIAGFEQQKVEIDQQITELRAMLSGGPTETAPAPEATRGKRKKFSAASRRKMALAQKARWAKLNGEAVPQAQAPKPKRKLSAATRAALAANLKRARAVKAAMAKATAKRTPAQATAPKPKRKLSAAGRAAIIAATKKMWAAKRAAAKEA